MRRIIVRYVYTKNQGDLFVPKTTHPFLKDREFQKDCEKIYLQGGRENSILRIHDRVHRPVGTWTDQVHKLLHHLRSKRFLAAPEPFGYDSKGREIVSFIKGDVSNYPLTPQAASINALTSAAKLLRQYHDASQDFLSYHEVDHTKWQLPTREPFEVMCHSDFAPYNVVLDNDRAIGIIDFDTCHPGPRRWDLAYALYRWSPFKNLKNLDGFGSIEDQVKRARLFCDIYEANDDDRHMMTSSMIERLNALVNFMGQSSASR